MKEEAKKKNVTLISTYYQHMYSVDKNDCLLQMYAVEGKGINNETTVEATHFDNTHVPVPYVNSAAIWM